MFFILTSKCHVTRFCPCGWLDTLTRQLVAQAGCLRRGRRAGRHVQLRTTKVRATATEIDTTVEIPVVTTHLLHVQRRCWEVFYKNSFFDDLQQSV